MPRIYTGIYTRVYSLIPKIDLGVFLAPSVPPTASRGSISFNKPASFMAFKRPYIVSVQNRQLEVHNLTNQKSMQLMPLPQRSTSDSTMVARGALPEPRCPRAP